MGELRELRQLRRQAGVAEEGNRERCRAGGRAKEVLSAHAFSVLLHPDSAVRTNARKNAGPGFRAGGGGSGTGGVSARMAAHHGAREQSARVHYFARQHAGGVVPKAAEEFCGTEASGGDWRKKSRCLRRGHSSGFAELW